MSTSEQNGSGVVASGDTGALDTRLKSTTEMLSGLRELVNYIQRAKSEISQLRPDQIKDQHLSVASDELDAIVAATEEATNEIMEAAEAIDTIGERIGGADQDLISESVTRIFQACSFQDITGQRISKVVGALKAVETKVESMVALLGGSLGRSGVVAEPAFDPDDPDAALLNGPQLPGAATSQDDIDALFN